MDTIFTPQILEAVGKLSVEVVAILSLALIVKWLSHTNKVLAESHRELAESHSELSKSIEKMSRAIKEDMEIIDQLYEVSKKQKCHFDKIIKKRKS